MSARLGGTASLYEVALAYYRSAGWPVEELGDGVGLSLDIEGSDGEWTAIVIADDEAQRFVFYSLSPVDAPESHRVPLAELLHRANHGLVTGAFEMDVDTGEMRLRTGLELFDLPDELRTPTLLAFLVRELSAANVGIFDRYLPGIVGVLAGADPAQVVHDIEGAGPVA